MSIVPNILDRRSRIHRHLVEIEKHLSHEIEYNKIVCGDNVNIIDFRDFEQNILFSPKDVLSKYSRYEIDVFFKKIDHNELKCKHSVIMKNIHKCHNPRDFDLNDFDLNDYDQEIILNELFFLPKELNTVVMLFL